VWKRVEKLKTRKRSVCPQVSPGFERYRAGTNLVLLSPDVAKHFPDEQSVNQALRGLIQAAKGTLRRGD
jgi:hypothetical protein